MNTAQQLLISFLEFWDFLKNSGQSKDFVKLASSLMSEDIPADNLAWLSALHIGRYVKCKTTCSMKYDQKYSEFFSLLYLLFGSALLNILHGPAQFGTVV